MVVDEWLAKSARKYAKNGKALTTFLRVPKCWENESWVYGLPTSAHGSLCSNSEACGIVCMQLVVLRAPIAWLVECMLSRWYADLFKSLNGLNSLWSFLSVRAYSHNVSPLIAVCVALQAVQAGTQACLVLIYCLTHCLTHLQTSSVGNNPGNKSQYKQTDYLVLPGVTQINWYTALVISSVEFLRQVRPDSAVAQSRHPASSSDNQSADMLATALCDELRTASQPCKAITAQFWYR